MPASEQQRQAQFSQASVAQRAARRQQDDEEGARVNLPLLPEVIQVSLRIRAARKPQEQAGHGADPLAGHYEHTRI